MNEFYLMKQLTVNTSARFSIMHPNMIEIWDNQGEYIEVPYYGIESRIYKNQYGKCVICDGEGRYIFVGDEIGIIILKVWIRKYTAELEKA